MAMQRLLLAIIGGIGAIGQAAILFHDLVDGYPYKVMSQPPVEAWPELKKGAPRRPADYLRR